ncbi:hypothetical protein RSO01_76190 [Reyranella soli]|uniref:Uncharacterized protein n=2 Tax=Reyranella soli TaxID=1230389 RepID=A0A512NNC2_9HYPH|nr:hypothetical protein RSO01_76190 [Reyranella soli]
MILTPPREAVVASAPSLEVTNLSATPQPEAPAGPRQVGLRVLAMTGEPVGINGIFDRFGLELMTMVLAANNRGETAFYATIHRSASEEGLFLAKADGKIARIAVAGDPVPDRMGQLIAGFGERPAPVMNDAADIAFTATLGGGRGAASVFLASEGKLRTIASSGMKAPVILGGIGVFVEFEAVSLNSRGDVAFLAWVRHGRETIEVVYVARKVGAVHQLTKVAATGEPAPGGGFFTGFGAPIVNDKGAVAFPAIVKLGPALGAIFVAPAEAPMHLLVGTGDPAPTGGIFARFSERIGFDDSGRVAFGAFTKGTGPDFGIFIADGADRRTIAAKGQPAPGGGVYSSFGAWPAMSHTGAVAFVAGTEKGPVADGVFLMTADGKVARVLSSGEPLMDGGKFSSFGLYPTVAIASDDSVSLLGLVERDGEQSNAVLRYGLAPLKPR